MSLFNSSLSQPFQDCLDLGLCLFSGFLGLEKQLLLLGGDSSEEVHGLAGGTNSLFRGFAGAEAGVEHVNKTTKIL